MPANLFIAQFPRKVRAQTILVKRRSKRIDKVAWGQFLGKYQDRDKVKDKGSRDGDSFANDGPDNGVDLSLSSTKASMTKTGSTMFGPRRRRSETSSSQ
ncbi:unnamed protein product, partial [Choristocarpus tenellus]